MRLIDLTGQRFGRLLAIRRAEGTGTRWLVKCDCGTRKAVSTGNLRHGGVVSCGCYRREVLNASRWGKVRRIDLSGQRFGRWVVLKYAYRDGGKVIWLCRCDCGTEKEVMGRSRRSGMSQSCGCLQREKSKKLPGYAAQTSAYLGYKHNSAARRNLIWGLSREQFNELTQQLCHYCGCPPTNLAKAKNGNGDFQYNGLDRKDSGEGYTIDNVVPCCKRCQRAKMDLPYGEFLGLVASVYRYRVRKNEPSVA